MWKIIDKPLIAESNMKHLNKDAMLEYKSIQEIRIIKDDSLKRASLIVRFWHIYKILLRSDHIWFGICCRYNGTSFTDTQRIIILMIRALTSMACAAIFYARSKGTAIGDITLTLYESLLGLIPTFLMKHIIKYYKPRTGDTTVKPGHFHTHTLHGMKPVMSGLSSEMNSNETSQIEIMDEGMDIGIGVDSVGLQTENENRRHKLVNSSSVSIVKDNNDVAVDDGKDSRRTTRVIKDEATKHYEYLIVHLAKTMEKLQDIEPARIRQSRSGFSRRFTMKRSTAMWSRKSQMGTTVTNSGRNTIPKNISRMTMDRNGNINNDGIEKDENKVENSPSLKLQNIKRIQDVPTRMLYTILANPDIVNRELRRLRKRKSQLVQEKQTILDSDLIEIGIIEEIRARIFYNSYKYPRFCKSIILLIVVIWGIACAIVTTIWCLWFETELILENEYYNSTEINLYTYNQCVQYIPLILQLNYNATESEINGILNQFDGTVYNPPENDSYGDDLDVSSRFLFTVFFSYMFSVFVWNPILLALKSIYKLYHLNKNPHHINEGKLFYEDKNRMAFVNYHNHDNKQTEMMTTTVENGTTTIQLVSDDN